MDRNIGAEEAGSAIKSESLLALDPPFSERHGSRYGGGTRMRPIDPHSPPAHISLEDLTAEFVKLYTHAPPPGRYIYIKVTPFPIE